MKRISILIAACLGVTACHHVAPMQQNNTEIVAEQGSPSLALRHDLIQGQLENGMKYILVKNSRPENRVSLQLIVHAGSLDEEEDQKGIAHLVEHMAFNGTEEFPANDLIEHQRDLGMMFGRDVNAMTEYYTTSYFLHLPNNSDEMMAEGFHMLSQQASALIFDEDELERERPVVEEEWRGGLNMMSRLGKGNREILLKGSRYGDREPIGDMDFVRHVDASRIKAFWEDWYHPNNMTMIVVGDTDQAEVEKMLGQYFADMPAKEIPSRADLTVPIDNRLRLEVLSDPEITSEVLSFNFREKEAVPHTELELREQLLNSITTQTLTKRLREQYRVESENVSKMMMMSRPIATGYRNNRLFVLLNGDDYLTAANEAFGELIRYSEHGFSDSDVDTTKQSIITRYEQMADSIKDTSNRRVMMSIFNRLRTNAPVLDPVEQAITVKKLVNSITLDEVNQHLAEMTTNINPLIIAQINPENQSKLPSNEQLQNAWDGAKSKPLDAVGAIVVDKDLISELPPKAEILSHKKQDGIDVWTLENGTTVWFEKSDETPNQLMIDYRGWGGSQHLPKELRRASLQLRNMNKFGYGGFTSDQITMLNAPYSSRMMTFVNQNTHGLIGTTNVDSLENWLQNMYLQITKPQTDAALWDSTLLLMERSIEGRLNSATGQFNSAINDIRYQNNPELKGITKEELESTDTTKLMKAWNMLFSSAKGNQLVIVGNADPEEVIALSQRYVGNLPASDSLDFKLLPKFAAGKHDINIASGEEPMAVTSMMFNKDIVYSLELDNEAYLLSRVVSNRMRKSLREAAGGVYTVRFGIKMDRDRNQAYGMISYGHSPKRGDELKKKAMTIVSDVVTDGITQEELNTVIAQTKQSLQPDNITDRQRIAYLKQAAQYGDSLTILSDYLEWLDNAKAEDLNKLAKSVLSTDNWINATLVPAEPAK